jgi:predicted AAA+ superfamily ATPase
LKVAEADDFYFWATHGGAELDLLLFVNGRRIGVELKRVDAPKLTRSMHIALEDLELDHLAVIYPGDETYPLGDRVTVLPIRAIAQAKWVIGLLRGKTSPRKRTAVAGRKK